MKRTIKIDLPELVAVQAALVTRIGAEFPAAIRKAQEDLARRRRDAEARIADVDRARAAVADGRADVPALERALTARDAASLLVAPAEGRVREAQAALDAETARARQRVRDDAARFRDEFQAAADQLAPVLDELRLLERVLDDTSRAAGGGEVPPLTWPLSLLDDAAAFGAQAMLVSSSVASAVSRR